MSFSIKYYQKDAKTIYRSQILFFQFIKKTLKFILIGYSSLYWSLVKRERFATGDSFFPAGAIFFESTLTVCLECSLNKQSTVKKM